MSTVVDYIIKLIEYDLPSAATPVSPRKVIQHQSAAIPVSPRKVIQRQSAAIPVSPRKVIQCQSEPIHKVIHFNYMPVDYNVNDVINDFIMFKKSLNL